MTEHIPGYVQVQKMDAHEPLFTGTCTCDWRGGGLCGSEQEALWTAIQHAMAKHGWKPAEVVVKLSPENTAVLMAKAARARVSVGEYMRLTALSVKQWRPRSRRDT